jgi:hypothetical protein
LARDLTDSAQPHRPGQDHQAAALLVAQSQVPAAARAVLPRRDQHPLRPWPRRHPGHPASPGDPAPSTQHASRLCRPSTIWVVPGKADDPHCPGC